MAEADVALQSLRTGAAGQPLPEIGQVNRLLQQSNGEFEVVGEQIEAGPYGIAVRKEDTTLRDNIQKALKAVIEDGTYDSILAKWHVTQGALKTAAINGGS